VRGIDQQRILYGIGHDQLCMGRFCRRYDHIRTGNEQRSCHMDGGRRTVDQCQLYLPQVATQPLQRCFRCL
jgi:hypothetical protein